MIAAALVLVAVVLGMQGSAHAQVVVRSGTLAPKPSAIAKVYKRPLMRPGRLQYCLKAQGEYDGKLNGRLTPATLRALRRFRDDLQLKADDVAQDWALHAALWRQCRAAWTTAGGKLDRFGLAATVIPPQPTAPAITAKTLPEPLTPPPPPSRAIVPPDSVAPAKPQQTPADPLFGCLPAELRDLLARSPGARPDVARCDLPCLTPPADLDREDAAAYERRLGFTYCKACVKYGGGLGLDDIARIEKAGNVVLCPDPKRLVKWQPDATGNGIMSDALRATRSIFRRDVRPSEAHNGIAVVVGVSKYANGLPPRPIAGRDAASVQALLVERLGFRGHRVIELKDPVRSELDGVFGRNGNPKGLLADRLKDAAGTPVFVYVSALGAISGEDGEAYLLPADATPKRERASAYALETLYQNLTRMGAGPITVVLEADFGGNPATPIVSPNAPETRVSVLPKLAMRGLMVFTSADRDQRPLDDAETGLSLFTRHLVAGLSGHADAAPFGNGDGTVDSAEAFVYAAQRTSFSARKLFGVLQRPMISQGRMLPMSNIGGPVR
jgi:Caspase domain